MTRYGFNITHDVVDMAVDCLERYEEYHTLLSRLLHDYNLSGTSSSALYVEGE